MILATAHGSSAINFASNLYTGRFQLFAIDQRLLRRTFYVYEHIGVSETHEYTYADHQMAHCCCFHIMNCHNEQALFVYECSRSSRQMK